MDLGEDSRTWSRHDSLGLHLQGGLQSGGEGSFKDASKIKRNYFSKPIPVCLLNFLQFLFRTHCVGTHDLGLQNKPLGTSFLVWAVGIHLCPGPWLPVPAYQAGMVLG